MNTCRRAKARTCAPTEECIYNLLPPIVQEPVKKDLYKSIYNKKVKVEIFCNKSGHKTFGQSDLRLRPPKNFLKKGEKKAKVILKTTQKNKKEENKECEAITEPQDKDTKDYCEELKNAPPAKHDTSKSCPETIPREHSRQEYKKFTYDTEPNTTFCKEHQKTLEKFESYLDKREAKKKKNYIEENVKNAFKLCEKLKKSANIVDTRNGHKYSYEDSGFTNKYSISNRMGKVPSYVTERKAFLQKNFQVFREKMKQKVESEAMKKLTEEERQQMIECLDTSREKLQAKFESLPLVITSKKTRELKRKLEHQLAQLEKDIRLFSAHKQIYVAQ